MSDITDDSIIPSELKNKLAAFDSSLTGVEECLQPLLDIPDHELKEKVIIIQTFFFNISHIY